MKFRQGPSVKFCHYCEFHRDSDNCTQVRNFEVKGYKVYPNEWKPACNDYEISKHGLWTAMKQGEKE